MAEIVYHYQPRDDGAYLPGIPARDLTAADVARLNAAQLRDATSGDHPLYVKAEAAAPEAPVAQPVVTPVTTTETAAAPAESRELSGHGTEPEGAAG